MTRYWIAPRTSRGCLRTATQDGQDWQQRRGQRRDYAPQRQDQSYKSMRYPGPGTPTVDLPETSEREEGEQQRGGRGAQARDKKSALGGINLSIPDVEHGPWD